MTQQTEHITEAVLAIDFKNEPLGNYKSFVSFFENHGCKVDDDMIQTENKESIAYTYYEKADTCVFNFMTDGEFFSPILIHFIEHLENNSTQLSVAELGNYGEFNTLVDMNLLNFKKYVLAEE